MDRTILNAIPFGWLALIAVLIAVTVGVGGFLLMRRFVPSIAAHSEQRTLSSAFAITASLFSFLLAFTIGQLYANFSRASGDAQQEANALAAVLRGAHGLPPTFAGAIDHEVIAYAHDVYYREWKLMRTGRIDVRAWDEIDSMYDTLEAAQRRLGSDTFFAQTTSAVNALASARQTRLDDVNDSIPTLFKLLLLGLAVLAIYGTFYFKPFGERVQVIMIGAASAMIGIALLVALALDYPYSGGITISRAPFRPTTIVMLSGTRPPGR
jgi:Protein of unknown function (DUF4239)